MEEETGCSSFPSSSREQDRCRWGKVVVVVVIGDDGDSDSDSSLDFLLIRHNKLWVCSNKSISNMVIYTKSFFCSSQRRNKD